MYNCWCCYYYYHYIIIKIIIITITIIIIIIIIIVIIIIDAVIIDVVISANISNSCSDPPLPPRVNNKEAVWQLLPEQVFNQSVSKILIFKRNRGSDWLWRRLASSITQCGLEEGVREKEIEKEKEREREKKKKERKKERKFLAKLRIS